MPSRNNSGAMNFINLNGIQINYPNNLKNKIINDYNFF